MTDAQLAMEIADETGLSLADVLDMDLEALAGPDRYWGTDEELAAADDGPTFDDEWAVADFVFAADELLQEVATDACVLTMEEYYQELIGVGEVDFFDLTEWE